MLVNHKRVARMMREDSLIGIDIRWPEISAGRTRCDQIYINLANRMKLTGINQVWVADITFIGLKREFVYLAAVLDRFSRRVIGWELNRTLTTRLPLAALQMALLNRKPAPGLVQHSDQGVQYSDSGYLQTLHEHGILASVSRPGKPSDNAICESFFRTLKREEIDAKEYRDSQDLRLNIAAFIELYYNENRLHSALGYRPTAKFERATRSGDAATVLSKTRVDLTESSIS